VGRADAAALARSAHVSSGCHRGVADPFLNTDIEVSNGLIAVDRFALFFKVIFLIAATMTVLMSITTSRSRNDPANTIS
jgi:hypothetical protein